MTHENYNELQTKMDKLVSDFVDEMADIETVSAWLDEKMDEMFNWVNTDDETVLAELRADYFTLKGMLLC